MPTHIHHKFRMSPSMKFIPEYTGGEAAQAARNARRRPTALNILSLGSALRVVLLHHLRRQAAAGSETVTGFASIVWIRRPRPKEDACSHTREVNQVINKF